MLIVLKLRAQLLSRVLVIAPKRSSRRSRSVQRREQARKCDDRLTRPSVISHSARTGCTRPRSGEPKALSLSGRRKQRERSDPFAFTVRRWNNFRAAARSREKRAPLREKSRAALRKADRSRDHIRVSPRHSFAGCFCLLFRHARLLRRAPIPRKSRVRWKEGRGVYFSIRAISGARGRTTHRVREPL